MLFIKVENRVVQAIFPMLAFGKSNVSAKNDTLFDNEE